MSPSRHHGQRWHRSVRHSHTHTGGGVDKRGPCARKRCHRAMRRRSFDTHSRRARRLSMQTHVAPFSRRESFAEVDICQYWLRRAHFSPPQPCPRNDQTFSAFRARARRSTRSNEQTPHFSLLFSPVQLSEYAKSSVPSGSSRFIIRFESCAQFAIASRTRESERTRVGEQYLSVWSAISAESCYSRARAR